MFNLSFIRIMLTVVLSTLCVVAQTPQPAAKEKSEAPSFGAIAGRVVNENGQPLASAAVSVRAINMPGGQVVSTDRDGVFRADGLEQKLSYYITVSLPAYASPPPEPGATPSRVYRVGDSVKLTLIKGGVVTGTVTNAAGDPLVGIRVRAQLSVRHNGRLIANGQYWDRETDDRGVYRLYGLLPGTYVVMAGGAANSWSSEIVDPYDTDVPTYAPSATRDTASEVTVRAGEETANIDIRYRGEQGRSISGVVSSTVQNFQVTLTAVGEGDAPWSGSLYPEMNGRSFSFVGIGDGDYDLFAYSYSENHEAGMSDVKRIRVRSADVTGIELTPRPLAAVAGRVVLDEVKVPECADKSRPLFEEMTVGAWHNDTGTAKEIPRSVWSFGVPVKPDAQGNFVMRNLAPGEYYFITRLQAKNWYIRAVQFMPSSTASAKKPIDTTRVWTNLNFGERRDGLTVTLVQGGASFKGELAVGEGEKVPPRTFIYLAPVERERADNPLNYFGTAVTSDGKIVMNNIAPGRYWIFTQTLPEDAPVPLMRVRYPHETETRAQIRREAEAAKTEIEFKPCQDVVDFKLSSKPRDQ